MGGLAEALTTGGGGRCTPEAKDLFERWPRSSRGTRGRTSISAGRELQAGEPRRALERWRALLGGHPADAPWRQQVVEGIQAAAGQLGIDPETVVAEAPSAPACHAAAQCRGQADAAEDVAGGPAWR